VNPGGAWADLCARTCGTPWAGRNEPSLGISPVAILLAGQHRLKIAERYSVGVATRKMATFQSASLLVVGAGRAGGDVCFPGA
jgi:hypothetical protein